MYRIIWFIFCLPILLCGNITNIIGVYPITILPQTDGYIGLPLERPISFAAKVEEVSGSSIRTNASTIHFEENSFLRVKTGDLEGYEFELVSVVNDTIEVNNRNIDLTPLMGNNICLIPYWTLDSIFEHSQPYDGLQVFVREAHIGGINRSPSKVFTFYYGDWYDAGFKMSNSFPIKHYTGIGVRNNSDENLIIDIIGRVPSTKRVFQLVLPMSYEGNDRFFTLGFPEGVELQGITGIPNMVSIMVYNEAGVNLPPSNIFTFYNGNWYDKNLQYSNEYKLQPEKTYVIRFLPPHQEFTWTFEPFYLQNW